MRTIGFLLVLLGALALGYQEITLRQVGAENAGAHEVRENRKTVSIPPVVGGIAVVSGLLLLALSARRGDT